MFAPSTKLWAEEAHSQRRRLPLSSFAAFSGVNCLQESLVQNLGLPSIRLRG